MVIIVSSFQEKDNVLIFLKFLSKPLDFASFSMA